MPELKTPPTTLQPLITPYIPLSYPSCPQPGFWQVNTLPFHSLSPTRAFSRAHIPASPCDALVWLIALQGNGFALHPPPLGQFLKNRHRGGNFQPPFCPQKDAKNTPASRSSQSPEPRVRFYSNRIHTPPRQRNWVGKGGGWRGMPARSAPLRLQEGTAAGSPHRPPALPAAPRPQNGDPPPRPDSPEGASPPTGKELG